jgi:exodeoxyribonuclease V alpha subunit
MTDTQNHKISGCVERIVSRNEDTGWAVLEVNCGDKTSTVIGNLSHVDEGLRIEADGAWSKHPTFGWQFKARSSRVFAPVGADGIERFLRSGAVEGIGPVFAKKIVDKFGDDTLKVIEKDQWRLKYLKGVGPKRIKAVAKGVKEYRDRMEVMSFLHGQLGPVRAQRVYEKYGDKSREIIAKDPYRLIDDFDGVGFKLADKVARDVGVDIDHDMRLHAAVLSVLKDAARQGHTCVSIEGCEARVKDLLGSEERAAKAVELGRSSDQWSMIENDGVACFELNRYAFLEGRVVDLLQGLLDGRCRVAKIDPTLAIPWAEERVNLELEEGQKAAVALALQEKVCVITGGPGVGKTTILNALLRILNAKKVKVGLAAPTGRASRRMAESTGQPAETIHKMLEYSPQGSGFLRKQGNPLDYDAVVVDESSMVDLSLGRSLLEAMPTDGKLVLVGDQDQLPSVGPGQVLADIIASRAVPVARLTKPFRQAGHSPIIRNAHLVNGGVVPDLEMSEPGFEFIETKTGEETASAIIETVCDTLPAAGFDAKNNVMCLIPMHGGVVGVQSVNQELQQRLNPSPVDSIVRNGTTFGVGDKVMAHRNNRELMVFNGDIGIIRSIDKKEKNIRIAFDQQMVDYPFGELSSLGLAYVSTVHKSQGSEYDAVVAAVDMRNTVLLSRKLLYTAITRAKKRVVLVGQRRAIHIAVSEARAHIRQTKLKDRLIDGLQGEKEAAA